MENLFVCHTQAHLILATGLSLGRFKNDDNTLILFRDFELKRSLECRIKQLFNNCIILKGNTSASKSLISRIRWHREDNRILRKSIIEPYDRVFAVCDWTPPVQYCLKRCLDLNNKTEFIWLEDGILAYFQNVENRSGSERFAITKYIRKLFFKYLCGIGKVYDRDFNGMGGLKLFKQIYCLYPDAVREPYCAQRSLVPITNEEYNIGVSSLYDTKSLNVASNSVILIMDKLDTYLYPAIVKTSIVALKADLVSKGVKIYCKLHPREDVIWEELKDCEFLEKTIGAESLYLSLANMVDSINIIGVKSAGLMSAKKMGFSVASLFYQSGEQNLDLVRFYENIGIRLIK